MISFQFNITMSDLSGIPESDICPTCRETYVFEEDKGKGGGARYTSDDLRALFKQPEPQEAATPEAEGELTKANDVDGAPKL